MTVEELVELAHHPKVVAIGEAGLDYHYDNSPRDMQKKSFRTHIAAARETGLPLVIHAREADADIARMLEEESAQGAFPFVLHCFTGGPISRSAGLRSAAISPSPASSPSRMPEALRDIALAVPSDRLLVETDAPYLAPEPMRGRTNEPAFVVHTAARLAALRGVERGRDGASYQREFLQAVQEGAALVAQSAAKRRMSLKLTILGCGTSGGVPRVGNHWGACDPHNPKNRRQALLAAGRARRGGRRDRGAGRHPARSPPAAARCRRRLGRRRALYPRPRRPCARHRRSAHGRVQRPPPRGGLFRRDHRKTLRSRFAYCFEAPHGKRIPADPQRP